MTFKCKTCEQEFDTRHPLHKISSKRNLCGRCYKEKEPDDGRYVMVTEGTGSGKGWVNWHRKPQDPGSHGLNPSINYHINFNQRFQPIGGKKK